MSSHSSPRLRSAAFLLISGIVSCSPADSGPPLVVQRGAVWLELYRGESERDQRQEWLVLEADGTWLGTVGIPDGFTVSDITMGSVLGVWRDELNVEHPQVLRLTRD